MRAFGKLTARGVASAVERGMTNDGGGLYLRVGPTGAKSWIFRFKQDGKTRDMGLGGVDDVTLSEARAKAEENRRMLRGDGVDPIMARLTARAKARLVKTFRHCADEYIKAHRAGWSAKTADSWEALFRDYVYPVLGADFRVDMIDTGAVMRCIEPIWAVKTETASRVRSRIELVLDWAKVNGFRDGENPARWKGHLDKLLPSESKVAKVEHHPALSYREIANFMAALRKVPGAKARALELTILTGGRTADVVKAELSHFNLDHRMWTIPANVAAKTGRELRVPLSARAIEIIEEMKAIGLSDRYVFPGSRVGQPISEGSMLDVVRTIDPVATVHGMRACLKTWATEQTGFPREVIEMALGHQVGDATERAYMRGDMFARRVALAEAWAAACDGVEQDSVVKLVA